MGWDKMDGEAQTWQQLRGHLLRFARIQLPWQPEAAEDMVQEALLSAHEKQQQFQGGSQFQTWAFAILKNKINDHLRQHQRHNAVFVESEDERRLDEVFAEQFDTDGYWQEKTACQQWHTPENQWQYRQFQTVLQACLYGLPENTARVFMMREFLGWETQEVCRACGLTAAHYYVVMHRAREALRQCLQIKWFDGEKS